MNDSALGIPPAQRLWPPEPSQWKMEDAPVRTCPRVGQWIGLDWIGLCFEVSDSRELAAFVLQEERSSSASHVSSAYAAAAAAAVAAAARGGGATWARSPPQQPLQHRAAAPALPGLHGAGARPGLAPARAQRRLALAPLAAVRQLPVQVLGYGYE
ncbi:Protein of unknown function [Gryllus bimaculatus]|nr:Protein of unknown function [Gryllus bimaculatus]